MNIDNLGMSVQQLLQLAGINILATDDDQLFGSTNYLDEALLVHDA